MIHTATMTIMCIKEINELREKLHRQGLEVRTTDDRKGYVPMADGLLRESDPDKILAFVLRVFTEPVT